MFLRKSNVFLVLLCAALSLLGFYLSYLNSRPIPIGLLVASGPVTSAEAGQRRGRSSIHTVWFTIEGEAHRFAYPGILPRIRDAWERMEIGSHVEVIYAATPDEKHETEIWGLTISGTKIVGPIEAHEARLKNGYFGLALGFAFAGCAAYTWRQASRRRPA